MVLAGLFCRVSLCLVRSHPHHRGLRTSSPTTPGTQIFAIVYILAGFGVLVALGAHSPMGHQHAPLTTAPRRCDASPHTTRGWRTGMPGTTRTDGVENLSSCTSAPSHGAAMTSRSGTLWP